MVYGYAQKMNYFQVVIDEVANGKMETLGADLDDELLQKAALVILNMMYYSVLDGMPLGTVAQQAGLSEQIIESACKKYLDGNVTMKKSDFGFVLIKL